MTTWRLRDSLPARAGEDRMRQLLTVPQVAAHLAVSVPRVYELCRLGLVPGVVRLGRQIRLDARAVDEWIACGGRALPGGWRCHIGVGSRMKQGSSGDRAVGRNGNDYAASILPKHAQLLALSDNTPAVTADARRAEQHDSRGGHGDRGVRAA